MNPELIRSASAGDERAFAALLGQVRDQIFRWALVVTGDADDAEDITQQVSVVMFRKLAKFEGRSAFSTWLYRIVRNTAMESRSRAHHKREVSFEDEMPEAIKPATEDRIKEIDDKESVALIRAMFHELPPRQRELINLVDAQGYKAAEAAEMMGIEPETARVHLLRARRTLRMKMLTQHPERFES